MSQQTYTIEIAADHHEGEQFVDFLNEQGHDASLGRSTGNYVDGARTSANREANQILETLWVAYCDQ